MAPAPRAQPAPPLANRELNGEVLLEELSDLRGAHVPQRVLLEAAAGLRELQGARLNDALPRIKQLAASRFAAQPALAALLVRWTTKLKTDVDVPLLVAHFERLAAVATVLGVARRAAERMPNGGRG